MYKPILVLIQVPLEGGRGWEGHEKDMTRYDSI
jgi:hypothetical protein